MIARSSLKTRTSSTTAKHRLCELPVCAIKPWPLVEIDLACGRLPHHTSAGIPLEKEFPVQRDPAHEFEGSTIQHQKVDTGGQENFESLWGLPVEIGRNVDVGIGPGSAGSSTAVQVGKNCTVLSERLDCFRNSLVGLVHRPIVSPHGE